MKNIKNKDFNKDFAWSQFNKEEIIEMGDLAIATVKANFNIVKSILLKNRTYSNTIMALENATLSGDIFLEDTLLQIHLLGNVHTDKKIRETCQKVEEKVSKAMIDLSMDRGLYAAVEEYYNGNFKKEKREKNIINDSSFDKQEIKLGKLSTEKLKLLDDMRRDQKRMGFALSDDKFKALKKVWQKLSSLSSKFRNNINNYEDYILCNLSELDGCSERFISSLKKVSSRYKISLDYPEAGPFMSQAKNREKRKELSDKLAQKGGKKNLKILNEMIELRRQASSILGYTNYVDYKVEDRMAKNKDGVVKLLDKVKSNIAEKCKADFKSIASFAKNELNIKDPTYYDYSYVVDKMEKSIYKIDTEELRPYFETDRVITYMLDLFSELFDFKYEEVNCKNTDIKLWHNEVKIFKIYNESDTGYKTSYLMLDLYPREGKYGHAAAFNLKAHGEKQIALVCNFPRPIKVKTPDNKDVVVTPSLLSLGEVETLYHEFGHATHFILSDTELTSHNGFNVAWDFVETPSQMLEEWVLNSEELSKLGSHFESKESLTKEMIENIIKSKKFLSAYGWMRQIVMSELDLCLHLRTKSTSEKSKAFNKKVAENLKPAELYQKMVKKYIGNDMSSKSLFPASWGHMDGYDAGYYSYLWAKVYAVDFYSIFEKAKNRKEYLEVGKRYRKEILGAGASRDEVKSAKAFLGRTMSDKAFVRSL